MTQESTSGQAVAERVRAANLAVGGNSPVTAMLANSLKERKPLADTGELYDSIQAAENDASAFIFVPPGTFNESVTIDTAGLTLLGSGRATHITVGDTDAVSAVELNANNITVENISASSTSGASANSPVFTSSSGNNHMYKNVYVRESSDRGFNLFSTDILIDGATVNNCDDFALTVGEPRLKVVNSVFDGGGGEDANSAVYLNSDDSVFVNNIVFNANNTGININGNDNICGSNRIQNSANKGIYSNASDNIIFNNRVSGSGTTPGIDNASNNNTLDGNLAGPAAVPSTQANNLDFSNGTSNWTSNIGQNSNFSVSGGIARVNYTGDTSASIHNLVEFPNTGTFTFTVRHRTLSSGQPAKPSLRGNSANANATGEIANLDTVALRNSSTSFDTKTETFDVVTAGTIYVRFAANFTHDAEFDFAQFGNV